MKQGKMKRRIWIVVLSLTVLVLLLAVVGLGVFKHYYDLLGNYSDENVLASDVVESGTQVEATDESGNDDVYSDNDSEKLSEDELADIEEAILSNLTEMAETSSLYDADVFNVLLIGVDSRSDSVVGRSDAMILVSINRESKIILMTSFLRDIYVSVPGYGSNRLNAAYAFGGVSLLKDTIKANFGIDVDRCVTINFLLAMDFIDYLGGLDLELTADEIAVMNKNYIWEHNRILGNPEGTDILSENDAGIVHVNGSQAVAYARIRYIGTDFARTGRQRTIINLALQKVKGLSLVEISELLETFLPHISTDLTQGDCASLLVMALDIMNYEIDSMTIPADGTWSSATIRGMSVLTIDFKKNTNLWYENVEGSNEK